jgi:predicted deacetylase
MVAELGRIGVSRMSLLVIPDHHRRGHFLDHPAFCEWLKVQVAAGHEAVLHGYFHARKPRTGESFRSRWLTRTYTAGEGEFYDLALEDARELARKGRDDFRQAGLEPSGFIAPAWLLGEEAERAITELAFHYTTRVGGVRDLRRLSLHQSQSLCWSVRAAWRRILSLAWNAWLFRRLEDAALLRIAVHPVDIAHPRVWEQITRMISSAVRKRTPHTYESWLAATATSRPPEIRS